MGPSLKLQNSLTLQRLKEVLHYDPESGVFTWKIVAKKGQVEIGDQAGNHFAKGARKSQIAIDKRRYITHRLAWFYHYGRWPENCVDHIDGDFTNNRIANLREATHSQNMHNRKRCSANKSGIKGVHWCSYRRKWRVKISTNGIAKYYGRYATLEEAAEVRRKLVEELHGEFANHG